MNPKLSPQEIRRYSRHLTLPQVGLEGQEKLKAARVLCIGVGGLGSPLASYLGAAGVGTLGLVDFDVVDMSNLQRQILHHTPDVGRSKLESAAEKLYAINPNVRLELHACRVTASNAIDLLADYDVIADGTDNFSTRYVVNDACVLLGKPNVYASIYRFDGQVSVFDARRGPCYRCLYAEPPPSETVPSCAEGGVLGVLPGIVGTLQAMEAIKLILGIGEPLIGRLLTVDALDMRFQELRVPKNSRCPVCGKEPTILEPVDYESCAMNPVPSITPSQLRDELSGCRPPALLDVREADELAISQLPLQYHIPVGELEERVEELDPSQDLVVYCRSGVRSAHAVRYLQELGFARVRNLDGGINAWAQTVDPALPVY